MSIPLAPPPPPPAPPAPAPTAPANADVPPLLSGVPPRVEYNQVVVYRNSNSSKKESQGGRHFGGTAAGDTLLLQLPLSFSVSSSSSSSTPNVFFPVTALKGERGFVSAANRKKFGSTVQVYI
eukprot:GHVU01157400.1.p1 GENE.GHVU01157400.1~~GHVU01157400.1.p1  ORF type:complete len:123 (-),score=26.13 GHVU01157400.1:805-1173(-)